MPSLHTLNKSPTAAPLLRRCLRLAQPGSAIVLIEDAVYAAVDGSPGAALLRAHHDRFTFHALRADLQARGLAERRLIEAVSVIDDADFVALVVQHPQVISWY